MQAMTTPSDSTQTAACIPTVFLECPQVLRQKNCFLDYLTPHEKAIVKAWRKQASERLREALCCVPFYANRAEQARLAGDEMAYWLGLQGSEMTLYRPPKASSISTNSQVQPLPTPASPRSATS